MHQSSFRTRLATIAALTALVCGTAAAHGTPPPEVLTVPGVRLSDAPACNPVDPSLAPAPDGFVFGYTGERATWLRRHDDDRAAVSPEREVSREVDDVVVATAPNGSGMILTFAGDTLVARPFGAGRPLGVGEPLTLGTFTNDTSNLELGLLRLADGTYLASGNRLEGAIRFSATEVLGTLPITSPEIVQVGDVLWVARIETAPITTAGDDTLVVERRTLDGAFIDQVFALVDPSRFRDADLVADGLGRVTVTWGSGLEWAAQRFAADGTRLGDEVQFLVDFGTNIPNFFASVDVTSDAEGNRLFSVIDTARIRGGIHTALFFPILADGTQPLDVPVDLATVLDVELDGFDLDAAVSSAGIATVALSIPTEPDPLIRCSGSAGVFGAPIRLGGARYLLLRDGRFKVEVDWQDPFNGGTGIGHAVPDTEDAGSFWFFAPSNKEIEVKVLDGRTINGNFWVFAAGLSNIGYRITVTDQRTGRSKTYDSPPFEFGNFIDTDAFPEVAQ